MIGSTVGPYHILEQLGQGGMGIVYKAHDARLDRTVALKFLPPQLAADQRARERFMQEARAASALDHANICTIHDIGQTDEGRVYIVMAYYEGQTLKYRLDDGALDADEAVDITRQIARGLARAHEVGIVHRDIKPANIMVTDRGEVKILDFGLAKLATSADLTKEGSTIGTAAYMSPEQSRGEAVDARSDLWSLGVLAYEMLTGKRPFGGGYDAAMLYAILNEEATPIDRLNPDVPPGVVRAIERCLSKDPGGRFPTLVDFLDAFETAAGVSHSVGRAPAATVSSAAPEVSSPVRLVVLFAGAALITLVVVWAAMHFFGLPDWVFAAGIVLMAVGLPIMLVAGSIERKRSAMASGERHALTGLPSWLSVRRATLGGVLAMGLLAVASAAWMVLRALGIGPAGTLVTTGAFGERDFVVMAEFENRTQDEGLAAALTEAFRIDLSQSRVVNLVDISKVRDALQLMRRPIDTSLTPDVAQEVALRTGAKAIIVGEVSSVGRSFVVAARLLSADDGSELVALRENAEDDGAILAAVDRLSGRLRERIGESLVDIRGGSELEDVTTSSLEALRLYSEGSALANAGDERRAEELLTRALQIDSTFAMAWRKLSVVQNNANRPVELYEHATVKAYENRDRLTERERLLTEALYHDDITNDNEQVIALYEQVLEKWPDDVAGLNNLALRYRAERRFEEAVALSRRAMAVGESVVFRWGLINGLAALERWDEVKPELTALSERYPEDATGWIWRARMAIKQGDLASGAALLDSAEVRVRNAANRSYLDNTRSGLAELPGHYAEADRLDRARARTDVESGFEGAVLGTELALLLQRSSLDLADPTPSRSEVEAILRRYPLEDITPRYRPYPFLAAIYAVMGDVDRADALMREWIELVPEQWRGRFPPRVPLAMIALARGDRAGALAQIDSARAELHCPDCLLEISGSLYERMDSVSSAITFLERHIADNPGFGIPEDEGPTRYHLGNLYDRAGNPEKAIENYARFIELWKTADPDLQVYVRDAQSEIDRLLREQAREPSSVPTASGS